MDKTTKGISIAVTMFAIVGMFSFAPAAATADDEGCTSEFWKENAKQGAGAWPDNGITITPSTPITTFVDNDGELDLTGVTFLDALNFQDGPGVEGAEKILLRDAAAAMLNAAHDESVLDYPISFDGDPSLIDSNS